MSRTRRSKEACIEILNRCEEEVASGKETMASWARRNNISTASIYQWKQRYGNHVPEAREIKTVSTEKNAESKMLRTENFRLRQIVADLMLDKQALLEYTGRA